MNNLNYHSSLTLLTPSFLQIPKSNKKMFDECPWPFTMVHDPAKFVKDHATHVTVLWVALCQIYSRIEKARAVIP